MRSANKIIALLMALLLAVGLLPQPVYASESAQIHVSYHYDNPLYHDAPAEKAALLAQSRAAIASDADITDAASTLRQAIQQRQEVCRIQIQTSSYEEESFRELIHTIAVRAEAHTGVPTQGDYIMWQYGGWDASASGSSSNGVYTWTLEYTYSYYTTAQEEAQVTTKVNQVLSSLNVNSASDYEKIKAIYDYICANVTYDHDHLNDQTYKHQFTAYAALVQGTSVCQGYALLFYRLALELGVDARLISGTSRGEGHGWNIVKLGNKYYNADSTWDAGETGYTYFLKCPANFPDHTRNAEYETTDFHNAYPMASADYQAGMESECQHSYATEKTDATCTEEGKITYTCTKCGYSYSESIAKVDHAYNGVSTNPTCTEDGYTIYTCAMCGYSYTEVIPGPMHDYRTELTLPTCTENGYTTYICILCGYSYTDSETEAIGHSWDNGTVTKEPTGTETGIRTYTCENCGETKEEAIPACEHSYESIVTAPTCTEGGYTTHTCSQCGDSYIDSETTAIGHIWDEGTITKEPTATESGEKTQHCANCDNVRITKIPATGGVLRLQGANRYETAFKAADLIKTSLTADKFYNIVITSGTNFADALSGSYLATQYQAPILLVNQHTVQDVADYIFENAHPGARIFILGGEAAVPAAMDELLENDFDVRRLAGANRYETNLLILQEAGINTSEIMVCTGRDFADSLSVSALGKPILLVNKILTDSQKAWLSSMVSSNFNTVHIIGGTNAVAANMEAEFTDMGFQTVDRISGSNRYETSLKVAQTLLPLEPDNLILAYGQNYPDGLCGGVLAYFRNAPLILVKENVISYAKEYAETYGLTNGAVLGGPSLISDSAVQKIFGSDPILYP